MVIEGMKAMLNQIRYVELCATASNAYEAMEKVKENQPDLVITDINMPEISGVAAETPLGEALVRRTGALHLAGKLLANDWQGQRRIELSVEDAAPV